MARITCDVPDKIFLGREGLEIQIPWADLSQEALNYIMAYGIAQNLQDSYASNPDQKLDQINKRLEALKAGKPKAGGRRADSILSEMRTILIANLKKHKGLKVKDLPKLPDRDAVKNLCNKHGVNLAKLEALARTEVERKKALEVELDLDLDEDEEEED